MQGYPIDDRSDRQRASAAANILGDVEHVAARVVARLTGERVTIQDDNSVAGMPDLRIDYADGRVAYGEVATDIDRGYADMTSTLRRKGGGIPRELAAPELGRVWFIGLARRISFAKLDRELPLLFGRLEQAGVALNAFSVGGPQLANSDNAELRQLHELGIADVTSRATQVVDGQREPARILMYAAGISGPAEISWPAFIDWVNEILMSDLLKNKREKLARTQANERHLFLGISYTTDWAGFLPLSEDQMSVPEEAPSMPSDITHLWIMNFQTPGRCLVWYPELGWRDTRQHWKTD
jgi:hypothetical protein